MSVKISKMWSRLPSCLINLTVFLVPLIFMPVIWVDFLTTKVGLFVIGLCAALFVWSIEALKSNNFKLPFNWSSLSLLLIPITYLISALFSGNADVSILGKDFGYDSVLILTSLFVFIFLVNSIFTDESKAARLQLAIFTSVTVALLISALRIILPGIMPSLGFFLESSTNTIGQWYDLGIIAGLAVIASIISLELFQFSKKIRVAAFVLLILGLFNLLVVGFRSVWIILGLFSIIVFVYVFALKKIKDKEAKLPATSLITFILSFIFIIAGSQINTLVGQIFPTSFVEVRPSISATSQVVVEALKNDLPFGVGPINFDVAWREYKPDNFSLTELWNVDFRYGYNLISTFVVMGGLIHGLAWLVFFGLYLFYGFKAVFAKHKQDVSRFILVSSFITSLYMWVISFIYVPSFVNVLLTFTLSGLFISSLYREKLLKTIDIDITKSSKSGFVYIFSVVLLLLVVITSAWHFTIRMVSEVNYRQGQIALNSGDINTAEYKIYNSLIFYPNDVKIQQLTDVGLYRLGEVVNDENLTDEDRVANFRGLLSGVISNIQLAIAYDPSNDENYVLLGGLFEELISYGIEGSYDEAKAAYTMASELNPKDPSIVLALARLEVSEENYDSARELVSNALEIKGNYSEAVFLLSRIEVLEGNIDAAIQAVETAAQVRPNDPIVFFQLGLLRYQDERFAAAVTAFENAVGLNNNYDNALYFLGLSYDRVGREDEAIAVFSLLNGRYPENQEIQTVLNNLNDGLNPFVNSSGEDTVEELPIDETIE